MQFIKNTAQTGRCFNYSKLALDGGLSSSTQKREMLCKIPFTILDYNLFIATE